MFEQSEIVYSASDILERMKTENIASIRWSFLLITHTCLKKRYRRSQSGLSDVLGYKQLGMCRVCCIDSSYHCSHVYR